jgi:hypothetical protein
MERVKRMAETDSDTRRPAAGEGARDVLVAAPFRRYGYSANGQLVNHGAGHGGKHRG